MIALAPFLLLVSYLSNVANGFYLPGVAPKNFEDGEMLSFGCRAQQGTEVGCGSQQQRSRAEHFIHGEMEFSAEGPTEVVLPPAQGQQ